MISIQQALSDILAAIYGKDVRNAIHDAIYQINQNANEAVDLAQIKFGTDVTEPTSPVGSFIDGKVYFNIATGIIWKLSGGAWTEIGSMKSIDHIERTSQTGLTDTYTVFYKDDTTDEYFVQNGADGISVANITKASSTDNVDHYEVNLSNGTKTPNGFDVRNGLDGVSIDDVELASTVGNQKNYKVKRSDGSYTPNGFSVNDGISSYVYVRYSASFDGQGMVAVPTDQTVYIGIVVTTQATAPTDPAVYSWVRFIGKSGTGSGDMLKADFSTIYNNVVDKAAALFDGEKEISANQLMIKDDFAHPDIPGTVNKSVKLIDDKNNVEADTEVLAKFSDDGNGLKYDGDEVVKADNEKIVKNEDDELTLAAGVTEEIDKIPTHEAQLLAIMHMIAKPFGEGKTSNYVAGELCIKDNKLYKASGNTSYQNFIAANWVEVNVADEISALNNKLTQKTKNHTILVPTVEGRTSYIRSTRYGDIVTLTYDIYLKNALSANTIICQDYPLPVGNVYAINADGTIPVRLYLAYTSGFTVAKATTAGLNLFGTITYIAKPE